MEITIDELYKLRACMGGIKRTINQLGKSYPYDAPFSVEDLIGYKNTDDDILWLLTEKGYDHVVEDYQEYRWSLRGTLLLNGEYSGTCNSSALQEAKLKELVAAI